MKNFSYRSNEEKENLEAILRHRRRKFNRQQFIALLITTGLIASVTLYVAFHVYYTEFDGYVHVDSNRERTPFDIFLDSVYVQAGDIVSPGDTLYSYYIIDMLVEHANPNSEPLILSRHRDLALRHQETAREIEVLRVNVRELKKQIAVEDHNIRFGLSSNSHKLDLERQLTEAEARLQALLRELAMLARMKGETLPTFSGGGHGWNNAQIFDDYRSNIFREAKAYHLASDSAIVTRVMAPARMIFFEKEEILTTQHVDLEANNLMVVAYVPIEKMHRITNHSHAEVEVSSDFSFFAHVSVLGMRSEEIPENLRSYFTKKNTAVIAQLSIDSGQTVPFWTMAEGLPVIVRVRNTDTWGEKPNAKNYLWYTTGRGIRTDLPDDWHYEQLPDTTSAWYRLSHRKKDAEETSTHTTLAADTIAADTIVADNATAGTPDSKATAPAPVSAEAPKSPASATTAAGHYVVLGSLPTEEKAQQQLTIVAKTFPEAHILRSSNRWLIGLGPYPSQPDAQNKLNKIVTERPKYNDAWIWISNGE